MTMLNKIVNKVNEMIVDIDRTNNKNLSVCPWMNNGNMMLVEVENKDYKTVTIKAENDDMETLYEQIVIVSDYEPWKYEVEQAVKSCVESML